jgi:hypothetical protein
VARRRAQRRARRRWIASFFAAAAIALGFAGTWWLLRAPVEDSPPRPASAPPAAARSLEGPRAAAAPTPASAGDQAAAQLDGDAQRGAKSSGHVEAPREHLSDGDRRNLEDVLRRAGAPPEPGSR